MQTPQNWGGGGLSKYAHISIGTCQNSAYNSGQGYTNDSTVFSFSDGGEASYITTTILKAGKYHYDCLWSSRGTGASFSVIIGGTTVYSMSNNVASGTQRGEVTVSANDTCVVSVGSGPFFNAISVILTAI